LDGRRTSAPALDCNVLYKYCAKSRLARRSVAEPRRGGDSGGSRSYRFFGKRVAIPNSVDFKRQFRAACGYAELGMAAESIAELNAIDDEFQYRPEVLQLRLHHLMRRKQWSRALTISRRLCRAAPEASAGFLHAGFCLHQIGRTREAKELLLRGPTALLKEPIYYYNMGCYEVLLGNLKDARVHLQISFKMDSSFRDLAKRDPDLRPLHATL
jgi:tetratricopeptide (TPR) repeat protein